MRSSEFHKDSRWKRTAERARRIIGFGAFLVVSSVIGFNCGGMKATDQMTGSGQMIAGSDETQEIVLPVALLSSEQMYKAMLQAAAIDQLDEADPLDAAIIETYRLRQGSLPSGQNLKLATGPVLIAATNLASSICAKATARDAAMAAGAEGGRLFFQEMNFGVSSAAQTAEAIDNAVVRFSRNAWRRDPTFEEMAMFQEFVTDYNADPAGLKDPGSTGLLATSICTAVLSSFDALVY